MDLNRLAGVAVALAGVVLPNNLVGFRIDFDKLAEVDLKEDVARRQMVKVVQVADLVFPFDLAVRREDRDSPRRIVGEQYPFAGSGQVLLGLLSGDDRSRYETSGDEENSGEGHDAP